MEFQSCVSKMWLPSVNPFKGKMFFTMVQKNSIYYLPKLIIKYSISNIIWDQSLMKIDWRQEWIWEACKKEECTLVNACGCRGLQVFLKNWIECILFGTHSK